MPIIKSAIKRMRQTTKKNARNVQTKRDLKVASKDFMDAVDKKDSKKANQLLRKLQSTVDTAVKKNVIHKNKAARLKSNYNKKAKALGGKLETKPSVAKKPAAKKAATKKPTAKKATTAKPATKKTPVKKTTAKAKPAAKK